jgi:murein DD-endopeptidase MepM/ murein hydrolase activator NlpD
MVPGISRYGPSAGAQPYPGKELMTEATECSSLMGGGGSRRTVNQWRRMAALAQKGLAPLLSRYTTHLVVVLLVTVALSATGMELPGGTDYLHTPTPASHLGEREAEPVTARGGGRSVNPTGGPLLRAPVLHTTLTEPPTPAVAPAEGATFTLSSPPPEQELLLLKASAPPANPEEATRRGIITYTVRSGDTVSGIATHFGLAAETLIWSNPSIEFAPDLLKLGQVLTILPLNGAYHTVVAGDTLESVAGYYKVTVKDIVDSEFNQVPDDGPLPVGLKLVIPGGKKPYIPRVVHHYSGPIPEDASRGTGIFGWPATGPITCGFNCYPGHHAVDIGNVNGTPVYASDSGYVATTGWSDVGYGKMILIDHGNGFQTLYAHLYVILVEEGTSVAKGTLIGRIGDTGNATGPHLHFEIHLNGARRNPILYLPND